MTLDQETMGILLTLKPKIMGIVLTLNSYFMGIVLTPDIVEVKPILNVQTTTENKYLTITFDKTGIYIKLNLDFKI